MVVFRANPDQSELADTTPQSFSCMWYLSLSLLLSLYLYQSITSLSFLFFLFNFFYFSLSLSLPLSVYQSSTSLSFLISLSLSLSLSLSIQYLSPFISLNQSSTSLSLSLSSSCLKVRGTYFFPVISPGSASNLALSLPSSHLSERKQRHPLNLTSRLSKMIISRFEES